MKKYIVLCVLTIFAACAAGLSTPAAFAGDDDYLAAKSALERTVIPTVAFVGEDLEEVVGFCGSVTGLNFVLTPEAVDEEIKISLNLSNVSVAQLLRLVVRLKELRITYVDGIILVDLKGPHRTKPYIRIYDIRSIQVEIRDFPGPELSLETDDEGPSIVIGIGQDPDPGLPTEDIVEMIESFTGADTWEEDDRCSVSTFGGMLIVVQHPEVHRDIAWLLALLEGCK